MDKKIYLICHVQSYCYDGSSAGIVGVFWNLSDAMKYVRKKMQMVVMDRYKLTLEQVREQKDRFFVEETDRGLFVEFGDANGDYDDIGVVEKTIKDSPYIEVLFDYEGKTYCERVDINDVDLTAYEGVWNWCFFPKFKDEEGLYFELTALKGDNGTITMRSACINVFDSTEANDPFTTITSHIKYRKSWSNEKYFIECKD